MTWLLVSVGCAECRFRENLVDLVGVFDTAEDAMAAARTGGWKPRIDGNDQPLDGFMALGSDGGYEVIPITERRPTPPGDGQ